MIKANSPKLTSKEQELFRRWKHYGRLLEEKQDHILANHGKIRSQDLHHLTDECKSLAKKCNGLKASLMKSTYMTWDEILQAAE